MKLLVSATPNINASDSRYCFKKPGVRSDESISIVKLEDVVALDSEIEKNDVCVIFYEHPQLSIANRIADGGSPVEVARDWIEASHSIINLYRRAPKRTIVLDATEAVKSPEKVSEILGSYGIDCISPLLTENSRKINTPVMARCLASLFVETASELKQCIDAIEACSSIKGDAALLDETDIFDATEELTRFTKQEAKFSEQISDLRATIERKEVELIVNHKKLLKISKELASEQKETKQPGNDSRILLAHNRDLQNELETLYANNKKFKQKIEALIQISEKKIKKSDLTALFDASWYQKQAGKVIFPLKHYLSKGWKRGYTPHPLFDSRHYLRNWNADIDLFISPLEHYLLIGSGMKISPHPMFDVDWYLQKYPDIRAGGLDPLVHYVKHGWKEERDPCPKFSSSWYLSTYPDVRAANVNPLMHYLCSGIAEKRLIRPAL